tara:strand:+ start:15493 stop:16716 length:1224 start_codon:yes stop_codon:yes gene_type:complete
MGYEKHRRPIMATHFVDYIDPDAFRGRAPDTFKWICTVADLPTQVGGVITLADDLTYFFTNDVDLEGSRIQLGQNTVILGTSSENVFITSTGLSASTALITGEYTFPMRNVSITHGTGIALTATDSVQVLDWTAVNFVDCPIIGTIDGYNNAIFNDCALLNSANMTFTGSVSTIGWNNSIMVGRAGQSTFILDAGLVIATRFRIIYSALVAFGGATAINFSTSATVPIEGYILDSCAFSGGATYTAGVQFDDNKSRFVANTGVINSASFGSYTITGSSTETVIALADTPVKVLGTSVNSAITQRFTHSDNRMTYVGAIQRDFSVACAVSATSGNNKTLGLLVAKNGVVVAETESITTTSGNGRAEGVSVQGVLEMTTDDYIEIWVQNTTDAANVTIEALNVIVSALN